MSAFTQIHRGFVTVSSQRIHYREVGEQGKPILLLLHQSPSSSAMYEELMKCLAGDFHILAPDTPGFGDSDPPPGHSSTISIADYAETMHGFLLALGVKRCYLFGHHTGAGIAVQLEHDHRGTAISMVLSGPPLLTEEQKRTLPGMANPMPLVDGGSHLQKMWQRIVAKDPQAPLEIIQREVMLAFRCGDSYQASYRAVVEQPFAEQLSRLECPVLAFAGDCDPLYHCVEPTVALLARGEAGCLPGGERTYVCERQADLVAELIRGFIDRRSEHPRFVGGHYGS